MSAKNAIPAGHSVDDYFMKFRRASTEDTLELMYERAVERAEEEFSDSTLIKVLCEIERALDRRQTEMDTNEMVMKKKMKQTLAKKQVETHQSPISEKGYDPEREMARLLRSMA